MVGQSATLRATATTAPLLPLSAPGSSGTGAELVTLTRDHIELLVAHPPREPATMAQVAVEMLGYCPDLDVQGTGMVAVLANEVAPHRRWSFWWD